MSEITTRSGKGAALTHSEMDANFERNVTAKATSYTIATSDNMSIINVTASATISLPDGTTTLAAIDTGDFRIGVYNSHTSDITIDRVTGTDTIDGVAVDITLPARSFVLLNLYGTDYISTSSNVVPYNETKWVKQQYSAVSTLTDGATINWDLKTEHFATVTLGGNRALAAPTNIKAGGCYFLYVIQDGAGSRTLSFNSAYKFPGGVAPTLSTGVGEYDIFGFISKDGSTMDCLALRKDLS